MTIKDNRMTFVGEGAEFGDCVSTRMRRGIWPTVQVREYNARANSFLLSDFYNTSSA
jgi:hypothetical protein